MSKTDILIPAVYFVIGAAIGFFSAKNRYQFKQTPPPIIDTIYVDKIKTITEYKTKIINETIYINSATDSIQVDIRSGIRHNIDKHLQSR